MKMILKQTLLCILTFSVIACDQNDADDLTEELVDIDGNVYQAVSIGSQIWMAENLRVSHFSNGDSIPNYSEYSQWSESSSAAFCWYENNPQFNSPYGKLYNWFAVSDERSLCPAGWHVPSNDEWMMLINEIGGTEIAGGKLKTTGNIQEGTGIWDSPNLEASNEVGFSAVPAGYREFGEDVILYGEFQGLNSSTSWWTSSESQQDQDNGVSVGISHFYGEIFPDNGQNSKFKGLSVRCVKD